MHQLKKMLGMLLFEVIDVPWLCLGAIWPGVVWYIILNKFQNVIQVDLIV